MRLVLAAALLLAACGPVPTPSPSVVPSASSTRQPALDPCHAAGVTFCVLNSAVTQATIKTTICVAGWTRTVRPPATYTDQLKAKQIHDLGLAGNLSDYEEDHRMPLDLGGAPRDVNNLSPEAHSSSVLKDQDEAALGGSQGKVCRGQMTLQAAQQQMVSRWLAAYPGYRR